MTSNTCCYLLLRLKVVLIVVKGRLREMGGGVRRAAVKENGPWAAVWWATTKLTGAEWRQQVAGCRRHGEFSIRCQTIFTQFPVSLYGLLEALPS